MAEIKSTLDLIMEKTKGLTLSPQEKESIRNEEWLKKARGLIQKFLDDRVELGKIKEELFDGNQPLEWGNLLKKEIINGLDPEGENEKRFMLIDELLHIPRDPWVKILEIFNQKVEREKIRLMDQSLKHLSDQGITGSGILPNLERDPAWIEFMDQKKKAVKKNWSSIKGL